MAASLLAAVEATLHGKDARLVAKCDVPGIMAVFERWDVYDVDTLSALLASSFADLQRDLAPVAALSFLALLKATIGGMPSAPPPETPSTPAPTTPSTGTAPSCSEVRALPTRCPPVSASHSCTVLVLFGREKSHFSLELSFSERWLFSASKKDEQSANAIRKRIVPALHRPPPLDAVQPFSDRTLALLVLF